jgi:hypothetical protein
MQWWPEVLDLVSEHCHFIHARVGHAEGPQVCLLYSNFPRSLIKRFVVF